MAKYKKLRTKTNNFTVVFALPTNTSVDATVQHIMSSLADTGAKLIEINVSTPERGY